MSDTSQVIRVLAFILITSTFAIVMLCAELISRPSNSSTQWTQTTTTTDIDADRRVWCIAIGGTCDVNEAQP